MMQPDSPLTESNISPSVIGVGDGITEDIRDTQNGRLVSGGPSEGTMPPGLQRIGSIAETSRTGQPTTTAPPPVEQRGRWRAASAGLDRIKIDPARLSGAPAIRDTRIGVAQILDVLADVECIGAVVDEFAGLLDVADVQEALVFVARLAR